MAKSQCSAQCGFLLKMSFLRWPGRDIDFFFIRDFFIHPRLFFYLRLFFHPRLFFSSTTFFFYARLFFNPRLPFFAACVKTAGSRTLKRSPTLSWLWGKHGKNYSECMGKIVILMLDNSRKVDILKLL